MDEMLLWNLLLTGFIGLITWFAQSMHSEQRRLSILLNRTREEMAKEYVTKQEVHKDMNRILDRIEVLDAKLDRFLENRAVS
tara:strand:+ start:12842 stop:13087 length:246 start_codon:yes stop_codon:yes gene_type:complete